MDVSVTPYGEFSVPREPAMEYPPARTVPEFHAIRPEHIRKLLEQSGWVSWLEEDTHSIWVPKDQENEGDPFPALTFIHDREDERAAMNYNQVINFLAGERAVAPEKMIHELLG